MTNGEIKDIKLQQECVSKTIDALWKMVLKYREIEMGMTLEEAVKRFQSNAEYERVHDNLQGCLEFKQLAEWLEKLQKIEQIISDYEEYKWDRIEVGDIRRILDGNDD